jgi:hypothetical protein
MCVGALVSLCVEGAFRATELPLASALSSIDSKGVTRIFADFPGTTASSDFSKATVTACRSSLSRDCLPPTTGGETPFEISQLPVKKLLSAPNSWTPAGAPSPRPFFGDALLPST